MDGGKAHRSETMEKDLVELCLANNNNDANEKKKEKRRKNQSYTWRSKNALFRF